jgi:AcrR family transcriptional regulator
MRRAIQLPAPGRGAYDRSLSRPERDQEHRERLFRAAAEISLTGPLTVARIVTHAGVGRSTFYEFFDSPEHLLEQLELRALRALESALTTALTEARTPLERVRAVARRFLDALLREPHDARVVLASVLGQRTLTASLSPAGEVLRRALQQVVDAARAEGFWFKSTDELSVLAAAAAGEAIGRRQLRAPLREAPAALSELIVKLLR